MAIRSPALPHGASDTLRHHWHVHTPQRQRPSTCLSLRESAKHPPLLPPAPPPPSSPLSSSQRVGAPDPEFVIIDDPPPLAPPSSTSSVVSFLSSSSSSKRVYTAPPPPPPSSFTREQLKQQDIRMHDTTAQAKNEASLHAQVDFFLYEGIALLVADSAYLREWPQAYQRGPGDILSRKAVAAQSVVRAQGVMDQVMAKLRLCRGVTVGLDGWAKVRHDNINLCPVGRSVAYYWDSLVLKRGASADDQAGHIARSLRSIIKARILVVAIVTDNEAVDCRVPPPGGRVPLPHPHPLRCSHTAALRKKVLQLAPIAPAMKALRALLLAFKHSKDLRSLLKDLQGTMRKG